MSASSPSAILDKVPSSLDEDINHYCCCIDIRIGLCGLDLTHHRMIAEEEEVNCIVCVDLEKVGFCPVAFDRVCSDPERS